VGAEAAVPSRCETTCGVTRRRGRDDDEIAAKKDGGLADGTDGDDDAAVRERRRVRREAKTGRIPPRDVA